MPTMSSQQKEYEVIVLFEGYSRSSETGSFSNCTCTLIRGEKNIIVDTMTAWDGTRLEDRLFRLNMKLDDINYVICTHGHSDHIGCNYLFKKAMHIVGYCISREDYYFDFHFQSGKPYHIDNCIKVIPTPGHTMQDVSVIITTEKGIYAITGDLFENQDDEDIWRTLDVDNAELQEKHREEILKYADFIVPGHGQMFQTSYIWNKRKLST